MRSLSTNFNKMVAQHKYKNPKFGNLILTNYLTKNPNMIKEEKKKTGQSFSENTQRKTNCKEQ